MSLRLLNERKFLVLESRRRRIREREIIIGRK